MGGEALQGRRVAKRGRGLGLERDKIGEEEWWSLELGVGIREGGIKG